MSNIRITHLPIAVHALGGAEVISVVQPGNATGTTSQAIIANIRPINNRIPITTDAAGTFHLSNSGNTDNNPGTLASPWGPDIQGAMVRVSRDYDFHGVGCTFSLANGTYTDQGQAFFEFFQTTGFNNWGNLQGLGPKFIRVTSDSGNAVDVTIKGDELISAPQIPRLDFRNVTIKGAVICEGGFCSIHDCNWTPFDAGGFAGPMADFGQIMWSGVSTINGPGKFNAVVIGGQMEILCTSIVASGGIVEPKRSGDGFVYCDAQGDMNISTSVVWGTSAGGSWVGKRFRVRMSATLNVNGLGFSAIPGTSVGTLETGGKYIG